MYVRDRAKTAVTLLRCCAHFSFLNGVSAAYFIRNSIIFFNKYLRIRKGCCIFAVCSRGSIARIIDHRCPRYFIARNDLNEASNRRFHLRNLP